MKQSVFLVVSMTILCVIGIYTWRKEDMSIAVLNPQIETNVPIYGVETSKKVISLTFDTAWGNEDIKEVRKILRQEHVKATFFFSGEWVSHYPKDVKQIAKEGHDIGNHGDHHRHMNGLSKKEQEEEIIGAQEKVKAVIGEKMTLFRAPYGEYDENVVRNARNLGYQVIQWDVDSLDWKEYGTKDLIERVCEHKNLTKGSILLLHTGTKYTKKALRPLIGKLKEQGYAFLPVSKLIYKENYYIDSQGRQRKK